MKRKWVFSPGKLKPLASISRQYPWISDVTLTSMFALKESADAFPPLKSAAGGVVAIWDIVNRIRSSKRSARALSLHCFEVLEVMAEAILDPMDISSQLRESIDKFQAVLDDIEKRMSELASQSKVTRLLRLRRNEQNFADLHERLEPARNLFITGTTLRTELSVTRVEKTASKTSRDVTRIQMCMDDLQNTIHTHISKELQRWVLAFLYSRPLAPHSIPASSGRKGGSSDAAQ